MDTITMIAARETHRLVLAAAKHGGIWVSAAGGTAFRAAGEISRRLNVSYEDALRALNTTHPFKDTNQYYLYWSHWNSGYEYPRFSIDAVVAAAVKAAHSKLESEWYRAAHIAESYGFRD